MIIVIILIIFSFSSSSSSSSSNDIFLKAYLMYCRSVPAVSVIPVVLGSFIYSLKQIWWTVSSVPVVAAIPVILEIFWLLKLQLFVEYDGYNGNSGEQTVI